MILGIRSRAVTIVREAVAVGSCRSSVGVGKTGKRASGYRRGEESRRGKPQRKAAAIWRRALQGAAVGRQRRNRSKG